MKLSCVVTVEKAYVSLSKKTLTLIAKNTYKLTVIKKDSFRFYIQMDFIE